MSLPEYMPYARYVTRLPELRYFSMLCVNSSDILQNGQHFAVSADDVSNIAIFTLYERPLLVVTLPQGCSTLFEPLCGLFIVWRFSRLFVELSGNTVKSLLAMNRFRVTHAFPDYRDNSELASRCLVPATRPDASSLQRFYTLWGFQLACKVLVPGHFPMQ